MVMAPEHPFVDRLTTPDRKAAVEAYRNKACDEKRSRPHRFGQRKNRRVHRGLRHQPGQRRKDSDLDRRLRAHQLRHRSHHGGAGARLARLGIRGDIRFADLPVVQPPADYQPSKEEKELAREIEGEEKTPFAGQGKAINSVEYNGLATAEFKQKITADLSEHGLGTKGGQFSAQGLVVLPAALLGRAVSHLARVG